MVVCAGSEESAIRLSPDGDYVWDDGRGKWKRFDCYVGKDMAKTFRYSEDMNGTWVSDIRELTVKYLGIADESMEIGVVCASFNAG